MADSSPVRTGQQTLGSSLAGLLGLFAGLCTIFAAFATLADWYDEARQARWPVVSAVVDRGDLVESGRASRDGGATGWTLRYRVHYEADGKIRAATLTSNTIFSDDDFQKLKSWAAQHHKGSRIDVRYDPSREDRAVFASTEVTEAVSRIHNDLVLIAIAATLCAGLLSLARYLRARAINAPPAANSDGRAQASLWMGLLFGGLGLLMTGLSVYQAIHANPFTVDNVMGVPIGLMFTLAGILLVLPGEYRKWRSLLATLLVTCFAVTFDWVAFGPGERHFSGSINGIGFVPGELFGRAAFGFFAVILDICAIWMWIDLCRRAFGLSTGQGLSRIGFFGDAKMPTD
jgi:hypothetical protein